MKICYAVLGPCLQSKNALCGECVDISVRLSVTQYQLLNILWVFRTIRRSISLKSSCTNLCCVKSAP
jgi:hypothetical protein